MEKNKYFTKVKSNVGITLIALIVTIIVLIIIAGISIASLTGDNGIIKETNEAKVTQIEASAREQVKLAVSAMRLAIAEAHSQDNSYSADVNAGLIQAKLKEILNSDIEGLNGTFDFGGKDLADNASSTVITIGYTGDDYKNACNDENAKINYIIKLGQKTIDLKNEKNTLLESAVIPEGTTSLDEYAYYGCTNLETVAIPEGVTSIGESAFQGCTNLKSVTIPDSVTSIGARAFDSCTELTDIEIPDSVTSIGEFAFYDCNSITSIELSEKVTEIGYRAFDICKGITTITVDENNPNYSSDDNGVLFNKDKSIIIRFPSGSNLTSYTIPSSVKTVDTYSFRYCQNLTSVIIPDGVTSIGAEAFEYSTKIAKVTIPDSVTSIGAAAFDGCSALTSIKIPEGVTSIGKSTFLQCKALTDVTISSTVKSIDIYAFHECDSLKNITIPNGVQTIGYAAFFGAGLETVTIPNSVTYIEDRAFGCCFNLAEINFNGTVEEWQSITLVPEWNIRAGESVADGYTILCTDGKINKYGTVTMY